MSLKIPAISDSDSAGPVSVSEAVFGQPYNESLIHQIVTAYSAGGRAGTKAQKSRSDVRGGGSKPWRQKGNGRARSGTICSPLWRTGGVTFAARPRPYMQKINKKMYRAGIRSILSELLRQGRLVVSENVFPDQPKTKQLAGRLRENGADRALIVANSLDDNLVLASRNLPGVDVCAVNGINPVRLVGAEKVIMSKQAIVDLEERLA